MSKVFNQEKKIDANTYVFALESYKKKFDSFSSEYSSFNTDDKKRNKFFDDYLIDIILVILRSKDYSLFDFYIHNFKNEKIKNTVVYVLGNIRIHKQLSIYASLASIEINDDPDQEYFFKSLFGIFKEVIEHEIKQFVYDIDNIEFITKNMYIYKSFAYYKKNARSNDLFIYIEDDKMGPIIIDLLSYFIEEKENHIEEYLYLFESFYYKPSDLLYKLVNALLKKKNSSKKDLNLSEIFLKEMESVFEIIASKIERINFNFFETFYKIYNKKYTETLKKKYIESEIYRLIKNINSPHYDAYKKFYNIYLDYDRLLYEDRPYNESELLNLLVDTYINDFFKFFESQGDHEKIIKSSDDFFMDIVKINESETIILQKIIDFLYDNTYLIKLSKKKNNLVGFYEKILFSNLPQKSDNMKKIIKCLTEIFQYYKVSQYLNISSI